MRKLFLAFLVAVILLGGGQIFRVVAQANTFCAANLTCTVTALWNFSGGLQSNGLNVADVSSAQTLTNKTIPAGVVSDLTAQTANVSLATLVTPAANGFYRFSGYIVETTAAATSSTLPAINIAYTDADSSVAQSFNMTSTNASNTAGTVGNPASTPNYYFYAKSGVAIRWQTLNYLSNPASAMQFAVHVRLEGPF